MWSVMTCCVPRVVSGNVSARGSRWDVSRSGHVRCFQVVVEHRTVYMTEVLRFLVMVCVNLFIIQAHVLTCISFGVPICNEKQCLAIWLYEQQIEQHCRWSHFYEGQRSSSPSCWDVNVVFEAMLQASVCMSLYMCTTWKADVFNNPFRCLSGRETWENSYISWITQCTNEQEIEHHRWWLSQSQA